MVNATVYGLKSALERKIKAFKGGFMKDYQTFIRFLEDKFGLQYHGLDDEMPDAFNDWLADLDVDELIDYADEFARSQCRIALDNVEEGLKK